MLLNEAAGAYEEDLMKTRGRGRGTPWGELLPFSMSPLQLICIETRTCSLQEVGAHKQLIALGQVTGGPGVATIEQAGGSGSRM